MNKKLLSNMLFLILLIGGFALAGTMHLETVQATTEVSGILTSDTTWTEASGPYNLTGNVLVESGVTLTVEADTTVNFCGNFIRVNGSLIIQPGVILNLKPYNGGGSIQVNGLLTARGTSTNPIHVNGGAYYYAWIAPAVYSPIAFSQYSIPWNESDGSGCIIENAILSSVNIDVENSLKITKNAFIDNAGVTVSSGSPEISSNTMNGRITIEGGSPTISGNTIENGQIVYSSDYSGDYVKIIGNVISKAMGQSSSTAICLLGGSGGGRVLVERNFITDSYTGIDVFDPNSGRIETPLTILNNTIVNNDIGVSIRDVCSLTMHDNNIYNNTGNLELSLQASNDIDATYNWWGTTDEQAISQSIIDFEEDFDLGKVTFVPYLTEENPEAMPDPTVTIPVPTPTPTPEPTPSPSPTESPSPTVSPSPIPVPGQSYFFVESNSNVSELLFNSTSAELSFTVTGESGTEGYVKITVAKSLVSNVQDIRAYLDGSQLAVTITGDDDVWLLHFTYMHSTHQVIVSLVADATPEMGIDPLLWFASGVIVGGLSAVAVTLMLRRRGTKK